MSYRNEIKKNRRKYLLLFLKEQPDYALNNRIIKTALASVGHSVSEAALEADFRYLRESGLVEIETLKSAGITIKLVKITPSGIDVAEGTSFVDGVGRPDPDEV